MQIASFLLPHHPPCHSPNHNFNFAKSKQNLIFPACGAQRPFLPTVFEITQKLQTHFGATAKSGLKSNAKYTG
jgi:hypothetical protein